MAKSNTETGNFPDIQKYRILHLDDDQGDHILFKINIEKLDRQLEIIWFSSADEALNALKNENIDCVISDFQMPDINGLDFLKLVRKQNIDIPFIFYTGQGSEQVAADAFRSGADDYYSKEESFAQYQRIKASIQKNVRAFRNRTNYRYALKALQKSDEKFAIAGKAHYDVMYDWDLTTDKIDWFDKFEEALGYEKGEIDISIDGWKNQLHPEDQVWLLPALKQDKTHGEVLNYEYRIRAKNGSYRHWQEIGYPQKNEKGKIIRWIGVCRDVTEKKDLESNLQLNLIKLEETQRIANLGTYSVDFDAGQWEGSETLDKIFGISPDYTKDIDGWLGLLHPEEKERMLDHLYKHVLEEGNPFNAEYRIIRKDDGQAAWVHGIGTVSRNDDNNPMAMIGAIRDITETKKLELKLKDDIRRFQRILDSMPILAEAIDAKGQIIWWNKECERVTGYSPEEMIGNPDVLKIHYPDEEYRAWVTSVIENGEGNIRDTEFTLTGKDGKQKTISWNNVADEHPIEGWHTWAFGIDITARKATEEKLLELQQCLEQAESLSKMGSWVWDLEKPEIQWSKEMFNICDRPLESGSVTSAEEWLEYIHPDDREHVKNKIAQLFEKNEEFSFDQFRMLTRDGKLKHISMKNKAVVKDGKIRKLYGAIVDVTEQKRAEMELENAYRKLKGINEDLEAFSYTVSHDLKAPVRRISGFASILLSSLSDNLDQESIDSFNNITDSCKKMSKLIDAVLNLSMTQTRTITRTRINLNAMAEEILEKCSNSEKNRRYKYISHETIWLEADASFTRILMQNLISNAWKYTSKESETTIELGEEVIEGKPYIFIRDNGIGFETSNSDLLYKPFFRLHTDLEFRGSGIGLATVKRIVEAHGGDILAESEMGKGSTFYFHLT